MMNKQDFTKIAKKILHPRPKLEAVKSVHPTRDWFIGLSIATIFVISSIVWSVHMYVGYENTSVSETRSIDDGAVVYRALLVNVALDKFSEQDKQFKSLLGVVSKNDPDDSLEADTDLLENNESVATSTQELIDKLLEESDINESTSTADVLLEEVSEVEPVESDGLIDEEVETVEGN